MRDVSGPENTRKNKEQKEDDDICQKPNPDRKPQRSVSFNRDVRVKRIVSDSGNPQVVGALAGDGAGYLVTPVRRERLGKLTRKQIAEEAAKVLDQADRVDCLTSKKEPLPDKFYTLPARKKHRSSSQENLNIYSRRHSDDIIQNPPKKPPRTFASAPKNKSQSLLRLFKSEDNLKKNSDLRRSRSDVSNSKSKAENIKVRKRSGSESEEVGHGRNKKAQLSPIIEVDQREDYFVNKKDKNDEEVDGNSTLNKKSRKKWNKSSEENFQNAYNKSGKSSPGVYIIDVEKAQNIDRKSKKFNASSLKNKLKSFSFRSKDQKKKKDTFPEKLDKEIPRVTVTTPTVHDIPITLEERQGKVFDIPVTLEDIGVEAPKSPRIQEAIKSLEEQSKIPKPPEMIHSSQLPAEKLPLTRGRKVDTMVKRLSVDKSFMPPKTNLLVTPTNGVQHNNNQPFSYTRGLSPERPNRTKSPSSPVIYAQVVVGNGDPDNPRTKQTVHTVYNGKKHLQHSDSDEGLGYEESNFGRKYEEKSFTHFGDKFDDDFPITPKFKSVGNYTNGYYNEFKESSFADSSARGRGDGMDSRRRESLSEFPDSKLNGSPGNINGRSDLSYRRDLLESRINSRKFGDKSFLNRSPDFQENYSPKGDKYITEKTSSRYYRRGSNSPLGYSEKYKTETKIDKHEEKYVTESKTTTKFSDYEYSPVHNRYDNEPKSLDSQASDYRSSPENLNTRKFLPRSESPQAFRTIYTNNRYKKSEKSLKERDHYKSNPEINYHYDDQNRFVSETFHDSLRRQKSDDSPKRKEKYFDSIEERKDKFGDSGIENDFRRDSGERIRNGVHNFRSRELSNESEDEGFASSLLIASERQNLEDSRKRRDYDSDRDGRGYGSNKEEYRSYENRSKLDYVPRERSIDDGSHFDPRIDKEFDKEKTMKKVDKKPPKPQKKSSLEKVKSLFTRDSSKKKKDEAPPLKMVTEGTLRARYNEYKGSQDGLSRSTSRRDKYSENSQTYDYSNRRRLSTPSPSPSRVNSTRRNEKESGSWFKSLDSRLTRKKEKTSSTRDRLSEDEKPSKNLRFFGDTDIESSNDSVRYKTSLKPGSGHRPPSSSRSRSQSTRDLHQISEESRFDDTIKRNGAYKSLQNINGTDTPDRSKSPRSSLKPPASPARRPSAESGRGDSRNRRRKNEVSSVGSSTEGDSSQQSQRSVVYLHAATVGDIPDPNFLSRSRRAQSREELTSVGSSRMQPQVKTLSRSFSMLAPWKPRNSSDAYNIDYTNYNSRPVRSKTSGKTAKERSNKKLSESRKSSQNLSTLNRQNRSKSKENMSTLSRKTDDTPKSTTLYKKRDSRTSKENSRYSSSRIEDKKLSNKSLFQCPEIQKNQQDGSAK